jgi:hypothetical protein
MLQRGGVKEMTLEPQTINVYELLNRDTSTEALFLKKQSGTDQLVMCCLWHRESAGVDAVEQLIMAQALIKTRNLYQKAMPPAPESVSVSACEGFEPGVTSNCMYTQRFRV